MCFGLLGIILAVPVTAVLQVVLHRWHQAWRATWLPPATPMLPSPLPPARVRVRGGEREPVTLAGVRQHTPDQGRIGEVCSSGGGGKARVTLRIGQNPW
jgi:hypothetical protein